MFVKFGFKVTSKGRFRKNTLSGFIIEGPDPAKCVIAGTINEKLKQTIVGVLSCEEELEWMTELRIRDFFGALSYFRLPGTVEKERPTFRTTGQAVLLHGLDPQEITKRAGLSADELEAVMKNRAITRDMYDKIKKPHCKPNNEKNKLT
jgi:hypothetical protein